MHFARYILTNDLPLNMVLKPSLKDQATFWTVPLKIFRVNPKKTSGRPLSEDPLKIGLINSRSRSGFGESFAEFVPQTSPKTGP